MYFTNECYSNCYKETIHPISDIDKPDTSVDDIEIKPPATKRKLVVHKIGGNVEEYCFMYFTNECYSNCYKETIHPISDIDKPDTSVDDIEIKPPATKRKLGRHKKKRIPSQQALEGEKMTYTCSKCKGKGHNRKSCFNPIVERHCDFFMWCEEVRNFVHTTPSCCCQKDERIKNLETEVALLKKELRRHKSLLKKTRMVAQSLPKLFPFLKETDNEDGSDGESSTSMS
ncbi:hypothetical protein Taro_054285, partial [Colocasia esculenta]|nr:hypothetical protein [Colocasia esculenta]